MGAWDYLGVGLYTIPGAARLLQVSAGKLCRWAQGYTFAGGKQSPPVVQRQFPELKEIGVLTFLDLIELYLVIRFRQEGVSMRTIRENARIAADRYHAKHPFAVRRFHVNGRALIEETEQQVPNQAPRRLYEDLQKSQLVLDQVAESFFRNLEYDDDLASRYWPLGQGRSVVLDPTRSFGKPIDAKTGVPTRVLYEMSRAGETAEAIAQWYGVGLEAVHTAVEYEQSLAKAA